MSETLTADEQRALNMAVESLNEKAWGIGLALLLAVGLFVATNFLVVKGGSQVGFHLRLLRAYFPGYSVSFTGSLVGFVYAFVLGYGAGRTGVAVYYRLSRFLG
jgi:hypothetical protein